MIIAKTLKGKGVKILEDQDNWHGKPINEEQFQQALIDLGPVDKKIKGEKTFTR